VSQFGRNASSCYSEKNTFFNIQLAYIRNAFYLVATTTLSRNSNEKQNKNFDSLDMSFFSHHYS
jgi:hypothetical protein